MRNATVRAVNRLTTRWAAQAPGTVLAAAGVWPLLADGAAGPARAELEEALPRPRYRARRAEVCFDRPFGFLIVHRTSRLVLAAGWVAEPETETEPEAP